MPPAGLMFDSGTRVLSGRPTTLGSTDMTYTARDVDGDEIMLSFTIEVVTGAQPIFSGQTIDTQWYLQNSSIDSLTLPEAAGIDLPLTYTLAPTDDPSGMLPAGLEFDRNTRVLSGTPTMLGSTDMTYTASDSDGDEVALTFTITVETDTEPRFTIRTIDNVQTIQNSAVQRTLPVATGGNGIPTYTLAPTRDPGGMLPAGLTFNSDTRVLSGTPTAASFTDMTYTVRDTDGDEDTLTFRIDISTDGRPSFRTRTIDDQQYVRDQAIMQTLPEAFGGNGVTSYSLTPTPPPPGLEFDRNNRVLSGTPTTLGRTEMTYTARDFDGDEAPLTFTIEVVETDSMPDFGSQMIEDQEYVSDLRPANFGGPYEIPEMVYRRLRAEMGP